MPDEVMSRARGRLLARMHEAPAVTAAPVRFLPLRRAVLAAVALAVTTGGGAAWASQGSLPGEALYGIKLAVEDVRVRLTASPDRRFAARAAQASERLIEAEELMRDQRLAPEERADRIGHAMERYRQRVFALNELAIRLAVESERPEAAAAAFEKAEALIERHGRLVASATAAEPAVVIAIVPAIADPLDVEVSVVESLTVDDEGDDEVEREFERRHERRIERLHERLRTFRDKREDRP